MTTRSPASAGLFGGVNRLFFRSPPGPHRDQGSGSGTGILDRLTYHLKRLSIKNNAAEAAPSSVAKQVS